MVCQIMNNAVKAPFASSRLAGNPMTMGLARETAAMIMNPSSRKIKSEMRFK